MNKVGQKLTVLNSREVKKIKEILEKQFDYSLKEHYAYMVNENNRIFIIKREINQLELENLKIDRAGLYLGELNNTQFRLSKEGAGLLVREAISNGAEISNIVQISKDELTNYFKGEEITKDLGEDTKLIILSYQENILGCAVYKQGTILNFMPKIHRGTVIV